MNDLIVISAYTNTESKQIKLSSLLQSLQPVRGLGMKILVINRVEISISLLHLCDMYLWDKDNDVVDDYEVKYWTSDTLWEGNLVCQIEYKDYRIMGTIVLPIVKTIITAIAIAKSMSIDNIHLIDYDYEVHCSMEFIYNNKLLEDFEFVYYRDEMRGIIKNNFISFRTNSATDIKYERDIILQDYKKQWDGALYFPDRFILRLLFSGSDKVYTKDFSKIELVGDSTENSWADKLSACLYCVNGVLHLYAWNEDKEEYRIKIIVDNRVYQYDMAIGKWMFVSLHTEIEKAHYIEFYYNDKLVKAFNLAVVEDKECITKYARYYESAK